MTLTENANSIRVPQTRLAWGPFIAALLICTTFGWWFAMQQVAFLDPAALYPPPRLMLGTAINVALVALIPYIYCSAFVGNAPLPCAKWLPLLGLLPLLMVFSGVRLPMALRISLLVFLAICLAAFLRQRAQSAGHTALKHWMAFALIFLTQFLFNGYFSPLSLDITPFHVPGIFNPQIAVMMQLFRSFIWIKQFSLTSLDYSSWLIGPHTPISQTSPAVQVLSLLMDSPSMDITAFYRLLHWLFFALCICGSFGFYLLLNVGLRINWSLSAALGIFYTFFQEQLSLSILMPDIVDGISTQAVFPYAVCFILCAFRENRIFPAILAGAAIGASFLLLPPHFEVLFYMIFCFGILSLAAAWAAPDSTPWKNRFVMIASSGAAFVFISAFYLLPILVAQRNGELFTQGHSDLAMQSIASKIKLDISFYGFIPVLLALKSAHFLSVNRGARKEIIFPMAAMALALLLWPIHSALLVITTSLLHFEPNFDKTLYGRRCYFIAFCALMLAAMALEKFGTRTSAWAKYKTEFITSKVSSLHLKSISAFAMLIALCAILHLRPQLQYINPKHCPYYVTLEAELANYTLLQGDTANTELIRDRLARFERDVKTRKPDPKAKNVVDYAEKYRQLLKGHHIDASGYLRSAPEIYEFAKAAASLVDGFYTDAAYSCVHPADSTFVGNDKIFMLPNLASVYSPLPTPFLKLAGFTADSSLPHLVHTKDTGSIFMGTGPGLFVHNSNGSYDARFMVGAPLAHALYLLPQSDFTSLGTYRRENRNWELSPTLLFKPLYRKLFDIAGIDMIVAPRSRATEFAATPGFTQLEPSSPPSLPAFNDVILVRNEESYGMAYLANRILHVPESEVAPLEHTLWRYLTRKEAPELFGKARAQFYAQLNELKDRHDIILEAPPPPESSTPAGTVTIRNILGEATIMKADCLRDECELVYNLVKLPGWYAYADGKPLQISRANFAFLAVPLLRGTHEVWFIYAPASFLCFTLLSLVGLLLLPLLPRR